jgi:hypothetical protein
MTSKYLVIVMNGAQQFVACELHISSMKKIPSNMLKQRRDLLVWEIDVPEKTELTLKSHAFSPRALLENENIMLKYTDMFIDAIVLLLLLLY